MVYPPREDTFLLANHVKSKDYGKNTKFLEMGSGTGYISKIAGNKNWDVTAVDSNPEAVERCRENLDKEAEVIRSDLFKKLDNQDYRFIVFNPPYLPCEHGSTNNTSSTNGSKTVKRFVKKSSEYLKDNGACAIVDSTRNGWKPPPDKIVKTERHWFEQLRIVEMSRQFLTHQYQG